jgi:hypothetical protein
MENIIDTSKAREMNNISEGDFLSFVELQQLMNKLGLGHFPIDYVKSAPFLLSFMDYKVKTKIYDKLNQLDDDNFEVISKSKTMLLKRGTLRHYKEIPNNNARLHVLFNEVFKDASGQQNKVEKLLWIPATRPYYKTKNAFSNNHGYSKMLIFSKWEMVPRMIAGLTSYEAERLNFRKTKGKTISYFTEENDSRKMAARLRDDTENILIYPSTVLKDLYKPNLYMDADLETIRTDIRKQIKLQINTLGNKVVFGQRGIGGAGQVLKLIKLLDGKSNVEYPLPIKVGNQEKVVTLLADMAIGSPVICAFRMFQDSETAKIIAESFITFFNRQQAMKVVDAYFPLNDSTDYFVKVIRYCVDGNLQSVLDEFAYTLHQPDKNTFSETVGKALKIVSATTNINTTVDVGKNSNDRTQSKNKLRTHFALGYYNAKISEEAAMRTENIRNAFNSPFRPFVLATTSIGQEGLDFHQYCRKIMHWNLPANPVDLEQREGRINRYMCLAIRQNLAAKFGAAPFAGDIIWPEIVVRAQNYLLAGQKKPSGLIPFWCLPDDFDYKYKIERIVPMYPYSKDKKRYMWLIDVLSHYRLTLGQPRQEELIESLKGAKYNESQLHELYMNLAPFKREKD